MAVNVKNSYIASEMVDCELLTASRWYICCCSAVVSDASLY
jgi:hypothetical protein